MPSVQQDGQALQQFGLIDPCRADAETIAHSLQQIISTQLCTHEVGGEYFIPWQALNQFPNQGRLACAGPAGNHHKAFRPPEGIDHIGPRLRIAFVLKAELVIRTEPKRFSLQFVKDFVHAEIPTKSVFSFTDFNILCKAHYSTAHYSYRNRPFCHKLTRWLQNALKKLDSRTPGAQTTRSKLCTRILPWLVRSPGFWVP